MTKTFCDRCKREISYPKYAASIQTVAHDGFSTTNYADLCESCAKELNSFGFKWLRGEV